MDKPNVYAFWAVIGILLIAFTITAWWKTRPAKCDCSTVTAAKSDSLLLLNYRIEQAKNSLQMSDSIISEQQARIEQQDQRYQANRQGDERLKVKQRQIRKQVENLNNETLKEAIETF